MEEMILSEVLIFLFGTAVLFSVTRLITRWMDRKRVLAPNPQALEERLARIEQIVEATAIEVERVSEGQRFTTKVLTERTGDFRAPRPSGRSVTPH